MDKQEQADKLRKAVEATIGAVTFVMIRKYRGTAAKDIAKLAKQLSDEDAEMVLRVIRALLGEDIA